MTVESETACSKTFSIANDGSEGADKALALALGFAKQEGAALHIVCVEEISEFPETIGEVKNEKRIADRRYRGILKRAEALPRSKASRSRPTFSPATPCATSSYLRRTRADLLVIGATGHSTFYERIIGTRADRLVDLAPARACGKVTACKLDSERSPRHPAAACFHGSYLWIAIGSALGGVARFWCSGVVARLFGETFPWGTLLVNVLGSFVIGFFATLTGPDGAHLRRLDRPPVRHDRLLRRLHHLLLLQPADARLAGRRMAAGRRQHRRCRSCSAWSPCGPVTLLAASINALKWI